MAPQYQEGFDLYIYSYMQEDGNADQDLTEINSLNRHNGMQPIRGVSEMRGNTDVADHEEGAL